jgi:SAM-dependent methyltransferase
MIQFYKLLYRIGLRPWEELRTLPVAEQISALIDREERERQPPHGRALDLGCGSGIWSVELAQRGWQVTGIDVVPKAVRAARERARQAGVKATFEEGDVTELRAAGVGSDFDFVLDFGTVHGLTPEQRAAAGREVTAVTVPGATLLMYAAAPGFRWPLPRGASRADVEAAYVGWSVIAEDEFDLSGAPGPLKKARPTWYRLRRE